MTWHSILRAIYEPASAIADSLATIIQSTFYDSGHMVVRTRAGFEEAARRHSWLHRSATGQK